MGLLLNKAATPATPAADKAEVFLDTTAETLRYIEDTGTVREMGVNSPCAIVATPSGIANTETAFLGGTNNWRVYTNQLKAGSVIRVTVEGTYTAGAGAAAIFRIRLGTAGTTADTALATFTLGTSAASGTNIPFEVTLVVTMRTVGAASTQVGHAKVINQGTTGLYTAAADIREATTAACDTTASNWLTVTFISASASNTATIKQAYGELVKI